MKPSLRRGFALLVVLWVIACLAVLGLGVELAARNALAGARNRMDIARSRWRAEECAEQARAVITAELPHAGWRGLAAAVNGAGARRSDCRVELIAAGARLDVNAADAAMLAALFARLRVPSTRRDSLVDALLDWRDADDLTRPLGAERAWYVSQGRLPPRNGPFADVRELRQVRGFERFGGLDSVLGVEPARIALADAPLAVIAALPGFGEEAIDRVAELRSRGTPFGDLPSFGAGLSAAARGDLAARMPDLAARATADPESWILTSRATVGTPPITSVLELRLVRAGDRAAIVRRRMWVE